MRTSQIMAVALIVGLAAAGCDGTTEPQSPTEAVRIEAATATDLTGTVGTELTPAPTVRAIDAQGKPVQGVAISFEVERGGGTITDASVETDVHGSATVGNWTLGRTAGTYTLTARSSGPVQVVVFTANAQAGPVAQMTPVSGTEQLVRMGDTPLHPLVKVADSFSNPIPGAPVTFTVIAGDGSIESSSVVTSSDGIAGSGAWTLGPTPGVQQVRAESGAVQVVFSALAYGPPSDLQGPIAFVSDRDGDSEIYAVNPDGSGLERLTTNGGHDDAPAWSPDGGLIALVSDRDGRPSMYIMTADGSHVMRRTALLSTLGTHLAWSPSGSRIAFTTLTTEGFEIATVDNTDGTVTILTHVGGFNGEPSWSPDGRQIAFVSDRDAYDLVYNIYTMAANGSAQERRTEGLLYLHPTWSPDGSMIAFVYGTIINDDDMRFKVAIMSADGVILTEHLAWAGDIPWMQPLDPGSLTWSPDGSGIAYTFVDCDLLRGSGCSNVRSVKYVSLDGRQQGTIVENGHSPSWRR